MKKPPAHDHAAAAVYLMRAKGYMQRKEYQRALTDLDEALRLNPQSGDAWMVRVAAWVEQGDFRQALADVARRLELKPPEPLALLTRGNLHAELGELEQALGDFTEYLQQQPGTVVALRARAMTFARLHRLDEALTDMNDAVRLDPASVDAHLERGRVHQDMRSYPAALADYQKAVELGPGESRCYNQCAWMLAACPQSECRAGVRAVALARRGCELTGWKDANILDTLASAHAECGQFDEALRWAAKALEQASAEIKEDVTKHIQLFRDRQPARIAERA
jgi:tetratricopeptide (TPR) repeat protein